MRVVRHTATIKELIRSLSEIAPDRAIERDGIPGYDEMVKQGIGSYL